MITIYTDGASRGNPGPGGWGAIVRAHAGSDKERVIELGGSESHTTNNRMELTAAIKALEFIDAFEPDKVELYTDSEYVMKGMNEWVAGWQKRGWRTAGKKPVMNQDLWMNLIVAAGDKDIDWKYVAGHSGHVYNDRCDEIATAFADGLSITLYNGAGGAYKLES